MLEYDAIVVGAGPAGAVFATYLGATGQRVLVLDGARFPRDKPCGEGILPAGVSVLRDLGLLDELWRAGAQPIEGVRYSLSDGRTARASFPARPPSNAKPAGGQAPANATCHSAYGIGVRRLVLDHMLLTRARSQASVRVIEGHRVTGLARINQHWQIQTNAGDVFAAPLLVGADGYRSTTRRLLGWQPRSTGARYGVAGHFRLQASHAAALAPDVHVVMRPGLEAYLTPVGSSQALIAFLGRSSAMRQLAGDRVATYRHWALTDPILGRCLAGAELCGPVSVCGPFPARAIRAHGDGALLIGDAAGFLDPISGEGLARSLLGARLAASVAACALDANSLSASNLRPYADGLARISREGQRLTRLALLVCSSSQAQSVAMAGLRRDGNLLPRLLGVSAGVWGFDALSARDWLALFTGI